MINTIPTCARLPACPWLWNHLLLSQLLTITKFAVTLPVYEVVNYFLGGWEAFALGPTCKERVRP